MMKRSSFGATLNNAIDALSKSLNSEIFLPFRKITGVHILFDQSCDLSGGLCLANFLSVHNFFRKNA
jgi:hypothetical protein